MSWGKLPWIASNGPWSNSGSILAHYPLVTSVKGVVTKNFLKYLDNTGLTKNIFRAGQKAVLLQMSHTNEVFNLKFGTYICEVTLNSSMKRCTGPRQTGSRGTRTCRAKRRPASPNRHARSALFWESMQHKVLTLYRHFRTTYQSQL